MNARMLTALSLLLIAGCSQGVVKKSGAPFSGTNVDARAQNDGSVEKTALADSLTSLPSCTRSSAGMVGYVTSPTPGKFYVCKLVQQGRRLVTQWEEINLQGPAGQDGVNILAVREEFPVNAECPAGGKRLSAVPDLNRNQVADADERTAGTSITSCNVVNQLVRTVPIPSGSADCAAGGVRVLAGSDLNGNGALDESNPAEQATIQSSIICNGVAGADGRNGTDGVAGRDGRNGTDGVAGRDGKDGVTTILPMASSVTTLPREAVQDSCIFGNWGGNGQFSPWLLAMGPDSNRNGTLDEAEQPGAQFTLFCSGATYPVSYRDVRPTAAQFVTTATVTGNPIGGSPQSQMVEIKVVKGSDTVQLADILILRTSGETIQNLGVGLPQDLSATEFTFRDSVSVNGTYSYQVVIRTPAARVEREVTVTVSSFASTTAQEEVPPPSSCPTPPKRGESATVQCPINSAVCPGRVWGSGPYTDDSDPCKAAVHAGLLKNTESGRVKVTPSSGQSSYTESFANGVNTISYGPWPGSFVLSMEPSCQPANLDMASRLLDNSDAIKSGGIYLSVPLELPAVSADNNTHSILHIFKNGQRTVSKEAYEASQGIKQSLDDGESFCALVTAPSTTPITIASGFSGAPIEVRHEIPNDRVAGSTGIFFNLSQPSPNSVGSILCFNGARGSENSHYATVGDFKNAFGESVQICAASGTTASVQDSSIPSNTVQRLDWEALEFVPNVYRDLCGGETSYKPGAEYRYVKYNEKFKLWMGIVLCVNSATGEPVNTRYKLYLSNSKTGDTTEGSGKGKYFEATDTAGHGQDHCELLKEGFTFFANGDSITSGNCPNCQIGNSFQASLNQTYYRAYFGDDFRLYNEFNYTSPWGKQASSWISCDTAIP